MRSSHNLKFTLSFVGVTLVGALLLAQGVLPQTVTAASPQVSTSTDDSAGIAKTITVVGKGVVHAAPDLAEVTVGVEVIDERLDRAADDSTTAIGDIVDALVDMGIDEEDIQLSDFNVWCETDYFGDSEDDDGQADATRYHVTNNVTVKVRDLDSVTEVIDAAVGEGANNMYGVNYSLEDMTELESEARAAAVEDGRAKAEELAELTGLTVGDTISVSEVIGDSEAYSGYNMSSPSEVELSVSLQITYAAE